MGLCDDLEKQNLAEVTLYDVKSSLENAMLVFLETLVRGAVSALESKLMRDTLTVK